MAGEFQALDKAEITETALAQKLTGSRLEQHIESTNSESINRTTGRGKDVLHFENEEKSVALIQDVRNDLHPLRWICWTYNSLSDTDPDSLIVHERGEGAYDQVEKLLEKGQVCFVLLGLNIKSEGAYGSTKYVLITWVSSEGVKPVIKARSAQDRLQLHDFINKYLQLSAEWQASTLDEISEEKLMHKLQGSIYQEEKFISDAPRVKATINDGISKFNPDYKPNEGDVNLKVEWSDDTQIEVSSNAFKQILEGKLDWILFGYNNSTKITVLKMGEGSWDQIDQLLQENSVYYSVLSVPFGMGDYVQIKYIFVIWVGVKSKPSLKATSSQHRVSLYKYVAQTIPLAGELQSLSRDECSSEIIRKKLIGTTILSEDQKHVTQRSLQNSSSLQSSEHIEKFEFVDEALIEKSIKSVRDDSNTTNWVTFVYASDGSNKIQLGQTGEGGIDQLQAHLSEDQIIYILFGLVKKDLDYQTVKYFFITFIGSQVKPLHKARSSQHRIKLYQHVSQWLQLAGEIQILNPQELNEETLFAKLIGTRMLVESQTQTSSRKISNANKGTEILNFDESLSSVLELLLKNNQIDWLVLGDLQDNDQLITVVSKGQGSLDQVKTHFGDDLVRYALIAFKIKEIVEEVDYTVTKFVFISWCGPNVKPLARARSSQHIVPIYNFCLKILPLHAQMHFEKTNEIKEHFILEKLTGSRIQNPSSIQKETERLKNLESPSGPSKPFSENKLDISSFFTYDQKISSILDDLHSQKIKWVAFGYDPKDETQVILVGSSETELDSNRSIFKDDNVLYVVTSIKEFAVDESDDSSLQNYATTKFIQVNWVGKDVKPLQRARSSQHRVALSSQIFNSHLQLSAEFPATNIEEINQVSFRDKISGSRMKQE